MQTRYWNLQKNTENKIEQLNEAAELIKRGEVVSFPTETVYGLGADGLNGVAARKIFAAKGRPSDNPLILHIADKEDLKRLVSHLPEKAEKLMDEFWPGPLTLVMPKADIVPDEVSAGLDTVGIRMPSHPLALDFIRLCGTPLAAPSANLSGKPSPTDAETVLADMDGKIAGIIDGGNCTVGVESTVLDISGEVPMILRPGGITKEQLEAFLGRVELDPALGGNEDFKPKAPGMKYRHYAPEAKLHVLELGAECFLPEIVEGVAKSKKAAVICDALMSEKFISTENLKVFSWGSTDENLAENLYSLLRACDVAQVEIIFAQSISDQGIGLAVMNRMKKAAGQSVISFEMAEEMSKSGSLLNEFMLK